MMFRRRLCTRAVQRSLRFHPIALVVGGLGGLLLAWRLVVAVQRTVLRPANLPAPLITLRTQTPLTKKEAIAAFDAERRIGAAQMFVQTQEFWIESIQLVSHKMM